MASNQTPPPAARHTCLDCGEFYWLSPANYDRWGTVCPHCGVLS